MMKIFQNLTLIGPTGNINIPIQSFSYEFERQKWNTFSDRQGQISDRVPINTALGGVFSIVKQTDGRSEQIMTALKDPNQDFLTASIVIKTNKSIIHLNFNKVFPFKLSKSVGKDTITFSFETTNIPKFPGIELMKWNISRGRPLLKTG
jgi:hypothetical protein